MMNSLRIAAAFLMLAAVAVAAPLITSISPSTGPAAGGITITIDGSGFGTTPTINFNTTSVTPTTATDVQITFVLPPGSGTANLTISNGPESAQTTFNYAPPIVPPPVITSLSPARGLASQATSVVITGQEFGFSPSVTFAGVAATIIMSTATTLTVSKPIDSGGDVTVVVAAAGQPSNTKIFCSVPLTSLAGYYVDLDAEQVVPAPVGSYSDQINLTTAKLAPAGFYAPVAWMMQAIPCPPGMFSQNQGSASPTPAPAGRFVATSAATSSEVCPLGSYTPFSGMTQAIPSSPGYFVGTLGAFQQTPAPAGKFVAGSGVTSTSDAPAGSYTPVAGMSAAIPASPGYFVGTAGAIAQTPAPAGKFVAGSGVTSTSNAPTGSYTPVAGMSAAIPASPGYFVSFSGATAQQPAPIGHYAALSGVTSTMTVPAGYYGPVIGLQAPIPAPAGTYAPNSRSAEPLPVPPDYTTGGPAATTITPIPQIKLTAYSLGAGTAQSVSFETLASQNYGIFYTGNLQDYILLETVAGTGVHRYAHL